MIPIPSAQLKKIPRNCVDVNLTLSSQSEPTRAKRGACTSTRLMFYFIIDSMQFLCWLLQFNFSCIFLLVTIFSLSLGSFCFYRCKCDCFRFSTEEKKNGASKSLTSFNLEWQVCGFLRRKNFSSFKIFARNNFAICIRSQQLLNFALCFLDSLSPHSSFSYSETALHCNPLSKLCQTLCVPSILLQPLVYWVKHIGKWNNLPPRKRVKFKSIKPFRKRMH